MRLAPALVVAPQQFGDDGLDGGGAGLEGERVQGGKSPAFALSRRVLATSTQNM